MVALGLQHARLEVGALAAERGPAIGLHRRVLIDGLTDCQTGQRVDLDAVFLTVRQVADQQQAEAEQQAAVDEDVDLSGGQDVEGLGGLPLPEQLLAGLVGAAFGEPGIVPPVRPVPPPAGPSGRGSRSYTHR